MQLLISVNSQTGNIISNSNITLDKIFEVKNEATVGFLIKQGKQESVQALYLLALKELWRLCDNIFTDDSITGTILMLISEYSHIRPQEIILILKNGLAGKYGKTYGKVTTMEVMRWALEYHDERLTYFEKKATEKPKTDWKEMDTNLFKGIGEDKKKTVEKPAPRERTEQEIFIQECMKDFDKLCMEQGRHNKPIWFVKTEDGMKDIQEYLKWRISNNK